MDPRALFVRRTLRFWAVAGLLGLLLGASLRVMANGECPEGPPRVYTPGPLALANLSAQIDGARSALERQPRLRDLRAALVGHLLERARFTGAVSDLDAALALAQHRQPAREGRANEPHVDELLLEASTLAALHRFPEALARLDQALQQGAPLDVVQRERDTITLALGAQPRVLRAIADRRAASARQRPTMRQLVDHAAALAALGQLAQADRLLVRAMESTPDVSPLPIAQIAFQRGVLAAEHAGDRDAGERHYREALRLVPGFVRAAVHLAELEAERGDVAAARARLTKVLASEDPEPASRLASLTAEAPLRAELVALAGEHYRVLLARHRAAFLDHALEFALAHGPVHGEDASSLAEELLAARPNPRSYRLALAAAEARGDQRGTCALARAAQPLRATHPLLAAELATQDCP
jgi:tetratricopeptide (TPR) repeat protein